MNVYDKRNYGPIREGLLNKYIDNLCLLKNSILTAEGDEIYARLHTLYAYVKDISDNFVFEDDPIRSNFASLAEFVESVEDSIRPEFLLNPPISNRCSSIPTKNSPPEDIVDYIVTIVRQHLSSKLANTKDLSVLSRLDLRGECAGAAFLAADLASYLGLQAKTKVIEPGYLISSHLYMRGGDHAFTIVTIDDRDFLIDCTYSQFFVLSRAQIQKNGIMRVKNCAAGYFMTLTKDRQKVAEKILSDGWIELKEDELKHYLDGFTMSYRNGLYYERSQDFSFTTPYDVQTCWDFITYEKDLLEFEDEETLGYQYTPLKNTKMKFNQK